MSITNRDLYNYYIEHTDEFSVGFRYNYNWNIIEMLDKKQFKLIAELDGKMIRIYFDEDHNMTNWISLKDKCDEYKFAFKLDELYDILMAFVNVTYKILVEHKENIVNRIESIFGA